MIQIVAPIFLTDGYGEMARQLALGLIEAGADISIYSITFGKQPDTKNLKSEYDKLLPHVNRAGAINTVIQCLTADNFPRFRVAGCNNIGYCMWETTKLPAHWPKLCNAMDMILVPSQFCKKVFIDSGVTTRVVVLPIGTDVNKFDDVQPEPSLREMIGNNFSFYSIFEWSERKNPGTLLNAYYSAFGANDPVVLIIKSYLGADKNAIAREANHHRGQVLRNNLDYPRVICIPDFMTSEQMLRIHKSCDVYLGPVRGEGWSIPMFDAALAGNHIVTTGFSSQLDFLDTYNTHKYQLYSLVKYQLEPVHSMHNLYTADQEWASIDVEQFIGEMKTAYNNWTKGDREMKKFATQQHVKTLKDCYARKAIAKRLLNVIPR